MKKIVIGAILFLVASTAFATDPPATQARAFASELGLSVKGATCSSKDSDYDGYVSCTVMLAEPLRDGSQILDLECGYQRADD